MLAARRFSAICLPCRLSLASHMRVGHPGQIPLPPQSVKNLRANALTPGASPFSPYRSFSSTRIRRHDEKLETASEPSDLPESTLSRPVEPTSVENSARRARQLFGDALPRGHLSPEEYIVYTRLYGKPIFVDKTEHLQEVEAGADKVLEAELPDGSHVLLRQGEDGGLEEVETIDELEEDVESTAEDESVDETMSEEKWEKLKEERARAYHEDIYENSSVLNEQFIQEEDVLEDEDFVRAHPLTIAGRFAPSPSTVFLPKETFVDPVSELLTRPNHKHLAESANRIFGGKGLPNSAITVSASLAKEQKPIPLDAAQGDMGQIEGDVFLAAVMPGTYAAVMSTIVEVRRRLGSTWIERLLRKKGGPVILDAGSGGAGILAWHEILKAEWLRMQEDSGEVSLGPTPLGKTTVVTGSDVLRHRASRLLENTTFIPRLPDEIQSEEEQNELQPRKKYDLIIAPHTLWPLKQEYLRKEQLEKYWSLLNPKGGVLVLLEKGLPRGFEVVAAAREHLLEKHISSPDSTRVEVPIEKQPSKSDDDAAFTATRFTEKEPGMIIAPCTNHKQCPMYLTPGISTGRKDFCFFSQRYIRPPYLQRILDATDQNHEDAQFSYIAVQRGRDQRLPLHDPLGLGVVQNEQTTGDAFEGHEWNTETELRTPADVNPLTFPRLVLPALKRRGHIILDVCTPAGKLERWTVPKSFSKQAFRDARKARWGDLWALGAKTRIPKNVRLGRPRDEVDKKGRKLKVPKKQVIDVAIGDHGYEGMRARTDGRYKQERKIRGSGGRKGRKQKPMNILDE
ncbi:mitochondrial small ribosomal subunit Rsm22-domain-containing protein [Clohesyomyces aquaticus]|uniref:Mitochondrial small ribosomal subunit Rsm22-domain-containing protein n=1 Tax=Clohesyomyces aquaticus TaxID=1231657 RepID=A0A1Y1ZLA2_9PLEO|nr:mitochondrial small ribosomal subunit Rsm22-domain-containing protein [Clohesyomyces aquaticus]